MAEDSKPVTDPTIVFIKEREAIERRRKKGWNPEEQVENDFNWTSQAGDDGCIGLALSGGGVRAASLGLGVLQTFCDTKLIKSVDYLSTVSGGGYIGSHFSAAVVTKKVPPERAFEDKPASVPSQPGVSNDVRKLIYGGKYLVRPWEATNKYLIGLLLTSFVTLSGLLALAALVAFVWRLFDTVAVRDFLELFGLNTDIVAAFLPFFVFVVCWFSAWMLSYFRYQAEAPGRWAQRWLYFATAAFFIGIVLLLVNEKETKVGFLGTLFTGGASKQESTGTIWNWLLGLLGAALLPLLRPKMLLKMSQSQKFRDRVVFRVATVALLAGVPLAFVGFLGMRNISRTAADPDDNLRVGDIRNWPAFAAILDGPYRMLNSVDGSNGYEQKSPAQIGHLSPAERQKYFHQSVHELVTKKRLVTSQWDRLKEINGLKRLYFLSGWPMLADGANPIRDTWRAEREFNDRATEVTAMLNGSVLP